MSKPFEALLVLVALLTGGTGSALAQTYQAGYLTGLGSFDVSVGVGEDAARVGVSGSSITTWVQTELRSNEIQISASMPDAILLVIVDAVSLIEQDATIYTVAVTVASAVTRKDQLLDLLTRLAERDGDSVNAETLNEVTEAPTIPLATIWSSGAVIGIAPNAELSAVVGRAVAERLNMFLNDHLIANPKG